MVEEERDYSDYLQHTSNSINTLNLFSGFTLTIITLLLATYPNPKSLLAQITLFFLGSLLSVFYIVGAEVSSANLFFCRNVPPLTRRIRIVNSLSQASQIMWGTTIILLFLLYELTYLAVAASILYTITVTLAYLLVLRPLMRRRRLYPQTIEPKPT
jgi:hypothetical protein